MDDIVKEFHSELNEEVKKELKESGLQPESAFTSVFISYLADLGESRVANAEIAYCMKTVEKKAFGDIKVKVNGYVYDEYFGNLTLVVSSFSNKDEIEKINKQEADKLCKQASRLFKLCISKPDFFESFEESEDIYALFEYINEIKTKIDSIEVILLTDKIYEKEILDDTDIDGIKVKYDVWDIERLTQLVYQKKDPEKLVIKFKENYGCVLNLIKVPQESETYDSYIGYIPGSVLAKVYDDKGQKLIEKNVRSFLQFTGQVNKGIRDTLKNAPDMFMAYNNGISTIAEEICIENETENGIVNISEITGWQIVNGGQTTASIYSALKNDVSLDNVNVQMKLTVIKNNDKQDEIVSCISKYANSQNKITASDFSANDEFHVQLERLSRKIFIPEKKGKPTKLWFYERARGQYNVELSRQPTKKRKDEFKENTPKSRCITKTVAAKCYMCWNKYPDIVSKGLEANFVKFTSMIQEGEIPMPDEEFYCNIIAQYILFQQCDKIVTAQEFGGYKANINYYTIALLSEFYNEKIDFKKIWNDQDVSAEIKSLIEELCLKVWNHFANPVIVGINITQWCKKEECWNLLKERYKSESI